MTPRYYESHITIEPVYGDRLVQLTHLSRLFGFKVADLLMQKRAEDKPERSKNDTFTTGRGKDYTSLLGRMRDLESALKFAGFQVWRVKIEAVLLDERLNATTAVRS